MNLNIQPIRLLKGSHSNTDKTGQGCMMNVIAYLNGEPQITDNSPCVCASVRPIVIWLNDFLREKERHRLIPYIERAMGSATEDKAELVRRAWLAVELADTCFQLSRSAAARSVVARTAAGSVVARTAAWVAKAAKAAAEAEAAAKAAAAAWAAWAAAWAAKAAARTAAEADSNRSQIIEVVFTFLDKALPKEIEISDEVKVRAETLVSLGAES